MQNKLLKFSLVCVAGIAVLTANPASAMAVEDGAAGFVHDKDTFISNDASSSDLNVISTFSEDDIPIPGFNNIGIADVTDNLNIRKGPGENEKIIGKLPKNGGCDILEADTGSGWTKIYSNKITGYVKTDYLITGNAASKLALQIASKVATVNIEELNIREKASTNSDSDIFETVAKGEELLVAGDLVITYGTEFDKWVPVIIDGGDDSEHGTIGYVAKKYVDLSYSLPKASSMEELQYGKGVSKKRVDLLDKAKEYLGYRYVWGGTSLGKGVDCSGYTMRLYESIGITIPRTSRSQGSGGTRISENQLKVGDLVFYGNGSGINHVAIFIGNGKIIHASNKRDGIKISNMYYRNPQRYVRYIND